MLCAEDIAAMFDWNVACRGEKNVSCIVDLNENDPYSIFLALRLQSQLMHIRLKQNGPANAISAAIGLHEFVLQSDGLTAAHTSHDYMTCRKNRNSSGKSWQMV